MIKYVLAFAFDDLGRVVLIRKNKPAWQAGLFNGVGGKIEEGETALQAMTREFEEETSIRFEDWYYIGKMHGQVGFEIDVFTATSDRFRECETMETEEIVHMLIDHVNQRNSIENLPALIQLCLIPAVPPSNVRPFFTLNYG